GLVPDSRRDDNTLASADVIRARLPLLLVGGSGSGTIADTQDQYYRLDVPAGTDVQVSASFQAANEAEVFVRFGAVPDRSTFDFAPNDPPAVLQRSLLLTGTAGPYYVLVHGREGAGAGTSFALSAQAVTFGLRDI